VSAGKATLKRELYKVPVGSFGCVARLFGVFFHMERAVTSAMTALKGTQPLKFRQLHVDAISTELTGKFRGGKIRFEFLHIISQTAGTNRQPEMASKIKPNKIAFRLQALLET